MALDEEVTLITVKNVKNQNGFAEQQESKLTVDCREKSGSGSGAGRLVTEPDDRRLMTIF